MVNPSIGVMLTIAYLRLNYEPVTRMQNMLHQYFKPNAAERDFSLAISTGRNGARLTHNHARQFQFGTSPVLSTDNSRSIINIMVNYNARYISNVVPCRPRFIILLSCPSRYWTRIKSSTEMSFHRKSDDECYFPCSRANRGWLGRKFCRSPW